MPSSLSFQYERQFQCYKKPRLVLYRAVRTASYRSYANSHLVLRSILRAKGRQQMSPLAVATPTTASPKPSPLPVPTPAIPTSSDSPPAAPTSATTSSSGDSTHSASPGFDWMKHWYPVAAVEQLDVNSPHGITLLGKKLVLWQDGSRTWRCLEDACPHRMAPLSEGRVDQGVLMCSYHGWEFDGQGSCVNIPQAIDSVAQRTARESKRCKVTSYPLQEAEGLLWVWPDSSPSSWIDSAARPLPLPVEFLDPGQPSPLVFSDWFWRDVPYPWDALVENLLDPAHVTFAHYGVIGPPTRNADQPIYMEMVGDPMETDRIECRYSTGGFAGTPPSQDLTNSTYFYAPCHYVGRSGVMPGMSFCLHFYAVPITADTSRVYARFYAETGMLLPSWLPGLLSTLPIRWIGHLSNMEVLDGDNVLIWGQAGRLAERQGGWRKQYYMPTPADRSIVAFRRWLDEKAGGPPLCGSDDQGAPAVQPLSRYELLERYNSHVAHCKDCQQALSAVKNGKTVGQLLCASSLASASADAVQVVSGRPSALPRLLGKMAVAGALGGAVAALDALEQRFYFVDYRHDKR